jgi:negative regulator of flagellin synthesis FlgM
MKIQSSSTTPSIDTTSATGGTTRSEGRKSAAATPASGAGRDAGTVRIDPRASLLAAAEASLENVAAVDSARVDEIKRAIAEGRFEVDSRRVAERLVGSVRDLILTRSN